MDVRGIAAAALLFIAVVLTILAIVTGGTFWLLIFAAVCVFAAALLSGLGTTAEISYPLAFVLVLGLVGLASLLLVRLVLGWTSGPADGATPPRSTVSPGSIHGTNPGSGEFQTVGTEVRLRASATTNSAIMMTMADYGTPIRLTCYTSGQSILGDQYWYRAAVGATRGYVSGYWVDTGSDPAATLLPAC